MNNEEQNIDKQASWLWNMNWLNKTLSESQESRHESKKELFKKEFNRDDFDELYGKDA